MASKSANMQSDQAVRKRQRIQTLLWLFMALIFGALTLFLWMLQASLASPAKVVESPDTQETMASAKFESPAQIAPLHELDREVEPISFDPLVRDMRHYPKEFKDKQYLKSQAGKWTVQVMDVSEYEVITEYLNSREDREKFAFFRYKDESDQPRYILFYDTYPTAQMAMGAAKVTDFTLPANIRVIPEEINRYLEVIENYELADPVQNLNLSSIRKVKLQPTRREVLVRVLKEQTETKNEAQTSSEYERKGKNNTASSEAEAAPKSIKNSTDTDDTLVVNEARKVPATDNTQVEDSSSNSAAPAKKTPPQKETVSPKNTNTSQKNNNDAGKVDPIKALIEEKTN